MIHFMAKQLGSLCERVVFVGGATTGFFVTDAAAPEVRFTIDVDVIVEIASLVDYYKLEEILRSLGFTQPMLEGDPVCRWMIDGAILDLMPTNEEVLGFSNQWYSEAIAHSVTWSFADEMNVKIISPVYLLATKIEAFEHRGREDFLGSRDIEDIVTVVDGRPEIISEIAAADHQVRLFIAEKIAGYLRKDVFHDALYGHMLPDPASQARAPIVTRRLSQIASLRSV